MARRAPLLNDLNALQNKIKRDSAAYYEEFTQANTYFKSCVEVFQLNPTEKHKPLQQLVLFMAQVAHCYREELESLPELCQSLLLKHRNEMYPELRMCFCKSLTFLRKRNIVTCQFIIETFLELCSVQDKQLRIFIKTFIKSDIKSLNLKHKDVRVNTVLQNVVFGKLAHSNVKVSKVALNILVEMYRKHIWTDVRVVNAISNCIFSQNAIIIVKSLLFFVRRNDRGEIEDNDSDKEEENEEIRQKRQQNLKRLLESSKITKKKKSKEKQVERAKKLVKKAGKEEKNPYNNVNWPALEVLYDPQAVADRLFQKLNSYTGKFHIKLLMMDMISRLIGMHRLLITNFFPYMTRYLNVSQRDVTKTLLFVTQAVHDELPPDMVEQVMRTIANNFVHDQNADEVIAIGLNTIREMCARHQHAMTETLLEDLAGYKKHRNRGVVTAARSIIQLFRQINPHILQKKDRGKPSEEMYDMLTNNTSIIPCADVLLKGAERNEASGDENDSEDDHDDGSGEADSDDGEWETDEDEDISGDEEITETGEASSSVEVESDSEEDETDGEEDESEIGECPPKKKVKFSTEDESANNGENANSVDKLLTSRILTDEDFKKINIEKLRRKMVFHAKSKKEIREIDVDSDDLEENSDSDRDLPTYESIARVNIKKRHDKESRMATVLAGREGREKFHGGKKPKLDPNASTNNHQKKKHKNFMMMRQKSLKSKKMSFNERQQKLKRSMKKRYKH